MLCNGSNSIWQTLSAISDRQGKIYAYLIYCVCQILDHSVALNLLKALSVDYFRTLPFPVPTAHIPRYVWKATVEHAVVGAPVNKRVCFIRNQLLAMALFQINYSKQILSRIFKFQTSKKMLAGTPTVAGACPEKILQMLIGELTARTPLEPAMSPYFTMRMNGSACCCTRRGSRDPLERNLQ